jgi:hypothetical protein
MKPAYDIGRMFRCGIQEELAEGRSLAAATHGRLTEAFCEESDLLRSFREETLALTDQNFRVRDKMPQVLLEDQGAVSIREIAAECILDRSGKPIGNIGVMQLFNPNDAQAKKFMANEMMAGRLREAGAAVAAMDFTMFNLLVGQLLINSTLKGFEMEEFVLSRTAGTYPTEFVDGETIPGVSMPYSEDTNALQPGQINNQGNTLLHKPGEPYRQVKLAENAIILPPTEEHGAIISLDELSVWADRTALLAKNAADVAKILGIKKEQRGLNMLIGVPNINAPYKEKYAWDGAEQQIDAYQAGSSTLNNSNYQLSSATSNTWGTSTLSKRPYPFVNDVDNNPLNDWTAFQRADVFASKLVDPNTGLPIVMGDFSTVIAPYTQRFNIAHTMESYSVWRFSQMANLAPGTIVSQAPNLVRSQLGNIDVKASRLLRQQMVFSGMYGDASPVATSSIAGTAGGVLADPVWFYGNFNEALKYSTNWNIKVTQAPSNSEAEFTQGIKFRWRTDERGIWAWHNPRTVQRQNFLAQGAVLDYNPNQ